MCALVALTAASLAIRASRNVGAGVLLALNARAEICRRDDALVIGAALAAFDPRAIAANAVVQIGAHAAFAFLAGRAFVDAGSAIANLAGVAEVDALAAVAFLAGTAGADA